MTARLELQGADGARAAFALGTDAVLLRASGSGVEVAEASDARGGTLRIVPTRAGFRLEPMRAGAMVEVDGQELFCKDLADGDAFAVEGRRVVFRSDVAQAARATAATAQEGRRAPSMPPSRGEVVARTRERSQRERTSKPLLASFVSLALVVGFVALRWLDAATSGHDPEELIVFATLDFERGQYASARQRIEEAVRDGDLEVRAKATSLRARIDAVEKQAEAVALVQRAREAAESLRSFEDRYARNGLERPAARELVRMCDAWSVEHAQRVLAADGGASLVAAVKAQRDRAEAKAELAQPETAADAAFAARARLRFVVREYKAAVERIDAFVAAHPDDALARSEADAIRAEGKAWIEKQVARLLQQLDRGEVDRVREEAQQIERFAVLSEWQTTFAPVRDRIAAAAAK